MMTRAASKTSAFGAPAQRQGEAVPRLARLAIGGSVGLLLAGAVYLIAVRGEALLVDLAKLGAAFCF
ncbi:MAG: hypothetical protein NW223_18580 [Hyphomicrobiaceae bacterium]|nr:hypothetical protein [Hyphomicrobiaceae bacterium]